MCAVDAAMARACYEGALAVAPEIIVMVLAGTQQQQAVQDIGCLWAAEIFADRAYNDDATLVNRKLQGAVIHDATVAGPRIAQMVRERAIISESGKRIATPIDTICLHGDTAGAVDIAKSVRAALQSDGITIAPFEGRR